MAIPTATPHADGDVIASSGSGSFAENMAAYRTWVNTLVDAEFTASTIRSEHLVKPVIGGWPNNSVESTFQGLWWFSYGNLEAGSGGFDTASWGTNPKRITIVPWQCSVDSLWPLPIGKTIYLPNQRDVEVNLNFDYLTNCRTSSIFYPTGAGLGVRGGRFVLCRRNRATNVIVEDSLTEVYVYPSSVDSGAAGTNGTRYSSNGQMMMNETLAAGRYDIFVAYKRLTSDSLSINQIDVARVIGKIEAV